MNSTRKWTLASALVIVCVGLVAFRNALDIGFWTDDYLFLETAGRLSWQEYVREYFDPRVQWHWYRPMQGLLWWFGYALFGVAPTGYHLAQILLHLANSLLLFALTARVARRWRVGLLAALLYATLPAHSLAVFWLGVADPLAVVLFLLTLWLWLDYLELEGAARYALAYAAFVAALGSKEVCAVLPIVLFLADRWVVAKPASLRRLTMRYAWFALGLAVYGLLEWNVLTRGVFTRQLGYGLGGHILDSLRHHLTVLAFPWGLEPPWSYAWLAVVLMLCAYAAYRRERRALFLGVVMLLTLLPILPFQANMAAAPRYLYLPLMGSMIGVALLADKVFTAARHLHRLAVSAPALLVALVLAWHGGLIAEDAISFAGTARVERLKFRPVFQQHPTLAPGTLLYFIEPDFRELSGLIFARYGKTVRADSTDTGHLVRLRDYPAALVLYRDERNEWREQTVTAEMNARAAPSPPLAFAEPLVLEGFDAASHRAKRGDALIVILYWRANSPVGKDYTLFAHLVDAAGRTVAGNDCPLLQDERPTTRWRLGELVAEGIVLPIDAGVAPGEYQLQVGLYDPATLQRLLIVDARGQPFADKVILAPIEIVE